MQATTLEKQLNRITGVLFVTAIFISVLIYLLHIVTHFPFFDGSIHIRYLWLIASGFRPNVDFFCLYPTLGYFLTLPYFKLFPESAFVLLALRLYSAVIVALIGLTFYFHGRRISRDWVTSLIPFLLIGTDRSVGVFFSEYSIDHISALASILALTIIMSRPTTGRIALCAMLSVISLFIMPKYHFPLFFGLIGYLGAYYAQSRKIWPAIGALLAGAAGALLAVKGVFLLNDGSLTNNFKYAYLFNFRFSSALDQVIGTSPLYSSVSSYVLSYLSHHPILTVSILIGIGGWLKYVARNWRRPDHLVLGSGGILLGCIVSAMNDAVYCEQYITPVLICLALFVPFAFSELFPSPKAGRYARLIFVIFLFYKLVVRLDHVADEFQLTPYNARGNTPTTRKLLGEIVMAPTGINILNEYDDLLAIIPRNEPVVAAWPFHPLFRRDLTFQIFDDRPSLSLGFPGKGAMFKTFDASVFEKALERTPPALIVLKGLDQFYPPDWDRVAQNFLLRHQDLYEKYATNLYEGYLRKDLLD